MASDTATDRYYLIEAIQSIFSYLIGLAAIFYSFVVDHAAGIMAFCGVVVVMIRVVHDGMRFINYLRGKE